ncbi:MAG: acyltransferase family protein [Pseudomonadota bacterium]
MNRPNDSRLFFLDWVRIIAFFVLIFYHVGMYYVSWGWHVKSPYASDAIEPLMRLTSPWRLSLLFLISGVASRFMLDKIKAATFVKQRTSRLFIPLLFGMYFIVPLQPYFEVVEKVAYQGSFIDFMKLYLQAYHGFCKGNECLTLPTWNHLWFVAYIWVYSLLLGALAATGAIDKMSAALARVLTGWKILVLPIAYLAFIRMAMFSAFPETHNLAWDWYNHAAYFALFLAGVLMARQHAFWAELETMRFKALALALACWLGLVIYFALPDHAIPDAMVEVARHTQRCVWAACQWSAIVAVCGFAHRHLQFDSAKRRYLTVAVFPVYIVHQTLIVAMAHLAKPLNLPPVLEGFLLVGLTLALSFGVVEIVRRVPLLQPLFGMPGKPRAPQGVPVTA